MDRFYPNFYSHASPTYEPLDPILKRNSRSDKKSECSSSETPSRSLSLVREPAHYTMYCLQDQKPRSENSGLSSLSNSNSSNRIKSERTGDPKNYYAEPGKWPIKFLTNHEEAEQMHSSLINNSLPGSSLVSSLTHPQTSHTNNYNTKSLPRLAQTGSFKCTKSYANSRYLFRRTYGGHHSPGSEMGTYSEPSPVNIDAVPTYPSPDTAYFNHHLDRPKDHNFINPYKAHVTSTFDNTLAAMTVRLQAMNATTDEKEEEIQQLKNSLEKLKNEHGKAKSANYNVDNASHSATIHSADSLNSLNSNSSYSQDRKSVSSKDSKDSKEKKTTWLRQSFGKAFKKKSKGSAESDSENFQQDVSVIMDAYGASAAEAEDIVELKRELEEKNLRLTDVQLESLASAQQLETFKEMMERMKNEMHTLKSDNERLHRIVGIGMASRGENQEVTQQILEGTAALSSLVQATADDTSPESSDLKRKLCLETASNIQKFDLLFGFPHDEEGGVRLPTEVKLSSENPSAANDCRSVSLGLISVSPVTTWEVLDDSVRRLFKEYVMTIDPLSNLGLNADSIHSYTLGEVTRQRDLTTLPEKSPYQSMTDHQLPISITLRGGPASPSCLDALAFDTLIPKTVLQRYMCLLLEHQRIMLCGPSGTGKTFLANRLSEYLVARANRRTERAITTFSVDHKSSKELRTYLANLSEQIESNCPIDQLPTVIILDNLHHVASLSEVFNNFFSVKHQRSPYIIGTMNQSTNTANNLQLHHNFRWVLCTNHMEPIKGFLGRYLRRKLTQCEVELKAHQNRIRYIVDWIPMVWQHINRFLENFSSADVTIGPRLFLPCPMDEESCKMWFTDLWNYSLVPYVLEAVREGIQLYGRRGPWEDPAEWIIKTWPWESPLGQDWNSLLRLRPEDVGYDSNNAYQQSVLPNSSNLHSSSLGMPGPSSNLHVATQSSKRMIEQMMTSNNTSDASDQLMSMLLRLQEVNISN